MHKIFAPLSALGVVALLMGAPMSRTVAAQQARQATVARASQQVLTPYCTATPLQTVPFQRRDVRTLPWIKAAPASVGISGHLFFATLPGTRFVRVGAHGTAAVLYTHGAIPGRDHATMKILWVFDNSRASDVLGPLTITGRNLTGVGTMHQVIPRAGSPGTDYPSIVNIPMPGCWRLHLQIKSLAADGTTFKGVVTMIVIK